jgi:hypothetical protein
VRRPGAAKVAETRGGSDVDMTTIAAFVAFIALVVAWMAAPTDAKVRVATIEPSAVGAD